jgi:nucleotide-binding universal stress UspA family protein/glutaredoxin
MDPIKIYGTNSSKYEYFKYELLKQLERCGIDIPVVEINDIESIMADNIEAIPTLRINNHIDLVCHDSQNVTEFLKETFHVLLKEFNYGNMKKILVPIDFSDASANAFAYANKIADKINGTIILAHYYHPTLESTFTNYKSDADQKLKQMMKPNAYLGATIQNSVYVDTVSKSGFAGDEIIEASKNFDLIIMGTSGAGEGIKKWLGSVSTKVSSKSKCPVLFIPPNATFTEINQVMYPLKEKMRNFDDIAWFLESIKPKLHVVHFDTNELHSPMIKEMLGKKSTILGSDNSWEVKYQSAQYDDVEDGIKKYITEESIDLVILEKGKEHFLDAMMQKSLTKKLTGRINIPVLVLNTEQKKSVVVATESVVTKH